ncbi:MAG: hypothetical protein ACRCUB_10995, partial [Plesiomonas shigelloides]
RQTPLTGKRIKRESPRNLLSNGLQAISLRFYLFFFILVFITAFPARKNNGMRKQYLKKTPIKVDKDTNT